MCPCGLFVVRRAEQRSIHWLKTKPPYHLINFRHTHGHRTLSTLMVKAAEWVFILSRYRSGAKVPFHHIQLMDYTFSDSNILLETRGGSSEIEVCPSMVKLSHWHRFITLSRNQSASPLNYRSLQDQRWSKRVVWDSLDLPPSFLALVKL